MEEKVGKFIGFNIFAVVCSISCRIVWQIVAFSAYDKVNGYNDTFYGEQYIHYNKSSNFATLCKGQTLHVLYFDFT